MASKTFYFLDALATGSNYLQLRDGGSPPGQARISTGWIVDSVAAVVYASMDSQTERAANSLTGTALPNLPPENVLGDSFRTQEKYNGNFALGNWGFNFQVEGETRASTTTDGRLRVKVWKSANADGSSATEITSGTAITTSQFTNLTNSAFQNCTGTASLKAFSLSDEYLFFQIALQVDGAGAHAAADVHLAIGAGNQFDTTNFVSTSPINASLISTLGNATSSASGKVATSSSLSKTLDSVILSSDGTIQNPVTYNTGTLSSTLGNISSTLSGLVGDFGDVAKTLDSITESSVGTVANLIDLDKTLDAALSNSSSIVAIFGSSIKTLIDTTLSSNGTIGVPSAEGTLDKTLDALIVGSVGTNADFADIDKVLSDTTLSSDGTVAAGAGITGTLSKTLENSILSAIGDIEIKGSSSKTLDNISKSINGQTSISGGTTKVLGVAILSSNGTVGSLTTTGELNATLGSVNTQASGSATIEGSHQVDLAHSVLSSSGDTGAGRTATLDVSLIATILVASGIVSPMPTIAHWSNRRYRVEYQDRTFTVRKENETMVEYNRRSKVD